MSDPGSNQSQEGSSSFFQPIKAVLAALSSALHTRLELFVTELEEERERLKHTLVLTFLLIFGFTFGFILFTIFIVALFWQNGWIAAIGALQGSFLIKDVFHGDYATVCSIMSLIYLVGMCLIWLAPETRGQPLPE